MFWFKPLLKRFICWKILCVTDILITEKFNNNVLRINAIIILETKIRKVLRCRLIEISPKILHTKNVESYTFEREWTPQLYGHRNIVAQSLLYESVYIDPTRRYLLEFLHFILPKKWLKILKTRFTDQVHFNNRFKRPLITYKRLSRVSCQELPTSSSS